MSNYRICTRCIMDTTDLDICFDQNGVCNHCRNYENLSKRYVFIGKQGEQELRRVVDKIKRKGKQQKYDCILGISGGLDSSYVAYLAKKIWLRPLAVHLDNEWDSETAKHNIESIVRNLDIDLCSYSIDRNELRELQLAYLNASVIDIEAVTDHAIAGALYRIANKEGIKYILNGNNIVTEGILPESWRHNKNDLINLKAINKQFGTCKLRTFPTLGLSRRLFYQYIKQTRAFSILNYVPYVKEEAKKTLAREIGWIDYGGKHYESVFTRFYQAYILPRKFGIDKRKAHLSTLICSGQITRGKALDEIQKELYKGTDLRKDKEFVLGKLGLTNEDFEKIMNLPVKSHYDYRSDVKMLRFLKTIKRIFEKGT